MLSRFVNCEERTSVEIKHNFTSPFIHIRGRAKYLISHMTFVESSSHRRFKVYAAIARPDRSRSLRSSINNFATHLQFSFGDVNFAAINKLDDELKVGECDFRRHDDDRMLARILDKKFLEKR